MVRAFFVFLVGWLVVSGHAQLTPQFLRCDSRAQVKNLSNAEVSRPVDTFALVVGNTSPTGLEIYRWYGQSTTAADDDATLAAHASLGGRWLRISLSTPSATVNAPLGTVVSSGTPTAGELMKYSDTTGTNGAPSGVKTESGNPAIKLPDADGDHVLGIAPASVTTTDVWAIFPAAPFSGLGKWTVSGTTNFTLSQATADTDYATPALVNFTQTGSHASPSTSNPLSPTWTGLLHTVWYGATGTINLPAAAGYSGRRILVYNTGAFTVTIDANGSEVIVRDGTVQTGGVSITLASGAGNFVVLMSDGTRWVTLEAKGTLAQGS
jgi:hypothetical protein